MIYVRLIENIDIITFYNKLVKLVIKVTQNNRI